MSLLNMSFSAAILILAIIIIRALLLHKLPKRAFLVLWSVALCRLLIPFEVSSRFSIYSVVNMLLEGRASGTDLPLAGIPAVPNHTAITETAATLPEAARANVSPLIIIWLIGLAVCTLFFLVTHLRCRKEYKTALPIDNAFVKLWQQEHPIWRGVQIRQSDTIFAPLTYGIFRPVVLLPKQMDWTDETRLRYILTHEFVHIRRFDTLKKLVMAIALCVHWFNPFVWLMYVLANRDIELSCDEAVVRAFGRNVKSAYALTLIGLEEQKNRFTPLVNNFSKNAIEERIVSIMKIKKRHVFSPI
ncbi:M56 family metallopeptidase [Paenibacillus doosanensis]|uniref:Regulatory protein BlaR1 n=1 Tax=Paenibacillus konkukensis TaxID=2020716 RepID=A0ABY4RYN7_9BACL|nr:MULTISPECIES: M56 family metallopeptidase [Paenibacillus]MCS7460382.1 M56 family metallopeptidase [Paenibacillus doosanensis]UQZ87432.1 Regulatory protein BlaR1 [Paenibacillus konkukensis]